MSKITDEYTNRTWLNSGEAKTIDHSIKQPNMFRTSVSESKKDRSGPSVGTLGLFGQTPDDWKAVQREEKW